MDWLRGHPYSAALGAAGFLVILGIIIIGSRSGTTVLQNPRVWGGGAQPLIDPSRMSNPVLDIQRHFEQATNTQLYIYTSAGGTESTESTAQGIDNLLAELSTPRSNTGTSNTIGTELAYSFIPTGLIATTSAQFAVKTDAQIALFNYGNEAGSYIQSYDDFNRNAPVILRNQAEDRQNEEKREAVRRIARSLSSVGRNMATIEDVPAAVLSAHTALAVSYQEIGGKLEKIPSAEGDEAFINAIKDYNASVEHFVTRYVTLARLFSIHGVIFAPHEAGSVFTFKNTSL